MSRLLALIVVILFAFTVSGKKGFGPGEQDWGYVDVREGAHMFYWLYYTTAKVSNYTERPLAIWLAGGPGVSSTGYGNFEELGPLDLYQNYRNHTWVKDMNVLFIDNPVGTGFSYVDDVSQLTTTNNQIALDLVEFMKEFYKLHSEFVDVPLHIFGESYGGKMAPEFALELYKAIKRGELRSNLQSVNVGNPFISPIDSVLSWAPFLLNIGIVDEAGHDKIMVAANKVEELINNEKWSQAKIQSISMENIFLSESKGADAFNIIKRTPVKAYSGQLLQSNFDLMYRTLEHFDTDGDRKEILQNLMRGPVAEALNIPSNVKWGEQSNLTYLSIDVDFMRSVIHVVSELLDTTNMQVSVFSGQLDVVCATPGTVKWIAKMQWSHKSDYIVAPRVGINVNGILEGYEKSAGNFTMFWINRAGHLVSADHPTGMDYILRKMTKYNQVKNYNFV